MKVSSSAEDQFIPMEAKDFEALQQQKRKRNEHWLRMRRARDLYFQDVSQADTDTFDFWKWLEVNFGLVPDRDAQGNITEGFAVIDEKLYTLFLLKFGE